MLTIPTGPRAKDNIARQSARVVNKRLLSNRQKCSLGNPDSFIATPIKSTTNPVIIVVLVRLRTVDIVPRISSPHREVWSSNPAATKKDFFREPTDV